jgi:hypothetical protein
MTFIFGTAQPGGTLVNGGLGYGFTGGTLQFTLSPKSPGPGSIYTQGTLAGTLSLSGSNPGGGAITLTGPISGTYFGQ